MKRLNPINFFKALYEMFLEIKNFIFYLKKVKKLDESGELKQRGLRLDYIKRLYFVKNIQPEALLYGESESGGTEQFEKQFIADALRQHNDIFTRDGSIELVKVSYKRIKTSDYYAYLIWIWFRFQKFTFWNILGQVIYVLFAIGVVKLAIQFYPYVSDFVMKFVHMLN